MTTYLRITRSRQNLQKYWCDPSENYRYNGKPVALLSQVEQYIIWCNFARQLQTKSFHIQSSIATLRSLQDCGSKRVTDGHDPTNITHSGTSVLMWYRFHCCKLRIRRCTLQVRKIKTSINHIRLYEENIGPLTPMIADTLKDAEEEYTAERIEKAFAQAVKANVRKWNYVEAILKRWKEEGYGKEQNRQDTQEDRNRYIEGDYADFLD